jgi:hypothetical protein
MDAGLFRNLSCGLRGLTTNSPPQLGQTPPKFCSAQSAQKVHSNEHIRASLLLGGRSRLQHSQLGRSFSMVRSNGCEFFEFNHKQLIFQIKFLL